MKIYIVIIVVIIETKNIIVLLITIIIIKIILLFANLSIIMAIKTLKTFSSYLWTWFYEHKLTSVWKLSLNRPSNAQLIFKLPWSFINLKIETVINIPFIMTKSHRFVLTLYLSSVHFVINLLLFYKLSFKYYYGAIFLLFPLVWVFFLLL